MCVFSTFTFSPSFLAIQSVIEYMTRLALSRDDEMQGESNSIKNKKEERKGFQKNPHLIIDEEAAKVVRQIYQKTEHELTMYENTRADLKMLLAEGVKITPKANLERTEQNENRQQTVSRKVGRTKRREEEL